MASVSGVSSSNASSIYGSRNVLSGLATGLDTETMIENAVSGYKTKINGYLQKQTKLSWKQEAMRSISDPMVQFARKYTSYTSSTNLLSPSFFNKAVSTTTNGANASKVSASGKSSSDIQILGVKQLASKATYSVSAAAVGLGGSDITGQATIAGGEINLDEVMKLSNVSGTMTLTYGANRTIDLSFDDLETYDTAADFVKAINKKLGEVKVSNSEGDMVSASKMVRASLGDDGTITFSDAQNAGNNVTITGATGKIKETLEIDPSAGASTLSTAGKVLTDESGSVGAYLSEKTFSMTVDGKTKTITMPKYPSYDISNKKDYLTALNKEVQKAFGTNISVDTDASGLKIVGQQGSSISINASDGVLKAMGIDGGRSTSYLNTGKSLGDILGLNTTTDADGNVTGETMGGIAGKAMKSTGEITYNEDLKAYYDSDGNLTDKDGNRLGRDGKQLFSYDFEINGAKLSFNRDTSMESVLTGINANSDMNLNAAYSKTTNKLQLSAAETGSGGFLEINAKTTDADGNQVDNLAAKLFGVVNVDADGNLSGDAANGASYSKGQDANVEMTINGEKVNIFRSDNTFDVDGLSITLKGTFGYSTEDVKDENGNVIVPAGTYQADTEAVTFTTTADADKIVTAITDMVKELNEIMKSVHDTFSTMPNYKNKKTRYEPLTEDDKAGMTETAIKNYEEKAKEGILFGDSDLKSMYSKLLSAISPSGTAGNTLAKMGITTSYSSGVTSLTIDEAALRDALSNNPDSVRDAFTSTSGVGGLMTNIDKVVSDYASTTGATKGILIEKAGSAYAALSIMNNEYQKQVDALDVLIDKWQDKLSDKIDYYTKQFTRLETLTNQMNAQSSALAGLMGG